MEEHHIDIRGIPKNILLAALYNASHQLGMGFMHTRGALPMSEDQADDEIDKLRTKHVAYRLYFDYLHGRVMKVDIGGDELYTALYNRDNGFRAAETVVEYLRKHHPVPEAA